MNTKVFFIVRAISGSGKSTISLLISRGYGSGCKIFSTDNYFIVNGKYSFDATKLHEYHNKTLSDVDNAMKDNVECIILDNTNLKAKDVKPYIEFAKTYGYSITVIEVDCGLEASKIRNNTRPLNRRIPDHVLEAQHKSFINARLNVGELVK